jgi:aspartate aminotransferase
VGMPKHGGEPPGRVYGQDREGVQTGPARPWECPLRALVTDSAASVAHAYHGAMTDAPATSPVDRRISRRIGAIAESATLKVDAKAKALKAEGRPVVGFGAGEPDFPTPSYIVEAAVEACRDPKNHRYTPAGGLPELKQAIADKTLRDSGYAVKPGQVVVTNGGKQAIYEAFATMLDPGDEVIVPAPYWTTYPEAIQLAGGVPVPVLADETQEYKVTVAQLEQARTDRTKVLLFVSPSNPTGAVYTADEIRAIGAWVEEHGLWVLTDEIYEHLVYDDVETGSLPVLCPELTDRCVVVNGVAKTYAMTGWRVGWLIAPADLASAAANLQSHATSNVSNVAQRAALAAVTGDLSAVEEMKAAFDRRRRTIVSMLGEIEGIVCPMPEGAFYAYPSVKGLLGKEYDGRVIETSADLAEYILEQAEVAVVPGEAFGSPGYLRLSYALGDNDLVEGITRLQKLFA